jgi:membrane-associated phospholipid phosphatase
MNLFDRLLEIPLTIVLIIGGYQFYFWCQRQTFYEARYLETSWDRRVVFDPRWVWIYSGLYYPMIVLAAMSQPDWPTYAATVGGFLFLLAVQMYFFIFHPVAIPKSWRETVRARFDDAYPINVPIDIARKEYPRSMRFLDLVWSYDKLRNSMPSMHVSVATMVDLTISQHWPAFLYVGWLFPVLIGVSAIRTKQHYLADVIPGALVGYAAFTFWWWLVA